MNNIQLSFHKLSRIELSKKSKNLQVIKTFVRKNLTEMNNTQK